MKRKTVQARLPEDVFDDVVAKAKKNRTTVSGLIRNLVEDFLDISEDLGDLASDKARKILFGREKGDLIGTQPFTLLKKSACANCEKELPKGSKAELAFYENSARGEILCITCVDKETSSKRNS